MYENLGITLFEILYFPKLSREKIEKFISFINTDIVFKAMKKGKGIFFISGHISNWELTAFAYSKAFMSRLNIIAKAQTNKGINKKINKYRELSNNSIIEVGSSLRKIYELIKKNEIVCFLMDQSANPDYSVYSDFFGVKVSTFSGPSKIALKNDTEMVFAYGYRTSSFRYKIIWENIDHSDLKGGPTETNIQILTDRINKAIEKVVREHPEQWLWIHRRFKHILK